MRARNVKPGLVENSILGAGDIYIQFLFGCLPMLADKEGRLKDDCLWIKAKIFPYRNEIDINGYLTVLSRDGFICRYESGGKRYIQITNFKEHQNPHHTEKNSIIPPLINTTVNYPLEHGGNPADSLIPDSLIPDSPPSHYHFSGRIIRLTKKDYDEFKKTYHAIPDFEAELKAADNYYAGKGNPKWFFSLGGWLSEKHQKHLLNKKPETNTPMKYKIQL